jgi:hypothetical protein
MNATVGPTSAQTPTPSSAPSPIMILENLVGPFVDRNLAARLGRDVIAAKYPIAILASSAPQVSDEGDTWVVTVEVDHWTEAAELFAGIKAIPVSIRKKDAAIVDIFAHGLGKASPPDAIRRRMESDASCRRCHQPRARAVDDK